MDAAAGGPVQEGNVGGGTGMICLGFKGGIGTASRQLPGKGGEFTVGALVQCNFGERRLLRIAGVPVGPEIPTPPEPATRDRTSTPPRLRERCPASAAGTDRGQNSIIVVLATDAPLLPHQLRRVARRAALGIGRMGGIAEHGVGRSLHRLFHHEHGDAGDNGVSAVQMLSDDRDRPGVRGDGAGHRGGDHQLDARRADHDAAQTGIVVPALPHDGAASSAAEVREVGQHSVGTAPAAPLPPLPPPILPPCTPATG